MANKRNRKPNYNEQAKVTPAVSQIGESLTIEQVAEMFKFNEVIFNAYAGKEIGAFSPMLTNQRLSQISFLPKDITITQLKKAFKDPIASKAIVTAYAQWLKFTDSISSRTASYLGNLPSFDMNYVCINPPTNRNDPEYLADIQRVKDFFNKFDYKGEFQRINRRTVVIDAYFGLFRTDIGGNYVFQELPADRCLITGRNPDYGFVYDFDVSWFQGQGIPLEDFPRGMRDAYYRVYGSEDPKSEFYNPGLPINVRDGTFSTWAQTSPLIKDGGFTCFKFNSDEYAVTPFLTVLFKDAINKDVIRELQNNQYIIASQKILVGLIPMLKEQKSGQVKDAVAIDPNTLATYLGFLKRGLNEAIKISGVPFSDLKDVKFELPQKNMYDDYTTNLAASSGVTSRVIHSSDKMTATEIDYSVNIDEMLATQVYPQYEAWTSVVVNSFTKKYKFRIRFSGSNLWDSKSKRFEYADKLSNKGMFIPQLFASALGYNPFDFMEMLADSKASNIQNIMQLPMNTNTKDYGEEGGRPTVEQPADSTERDDDF